MQALLLGGSIAHGFERPDSDVDLLIVVSDAEHAARLREGSLQFATAEGCEEPWPARFMIDTELAWQRDAAAIDEL